MVNVLDWFQLASNKENRMIQMRRYMHQYPEPSFEETWTHNYILNQLSHLDCEIESPIGRNGIKATFKGKENGPTVAFRADFDALPVQELKWCRQNLWYTSMEWLPYWNNIFKTWCYYGITR